MFWRVLIYDPPVQEFSVSFPHTLTSQCWSVRITSPSVKLSCGPRLIRVEQLYLSLTLSQIAWISPKKALTKVLDILFRFLDQNYFWLNWNLTRVSFLTILILDKKFEFSPKVSHTTYGIWYTVYHKGDSLLVKIRIFCQKSRFWSKMKLLLKLQFLITVSFSSQHFYCWLK